MGWMHNQGTNFGERGIQQVLSSLHVEEQVMVSKIMEMGYSTKT